MRWYVVGGIRSELEARHNLLESSSWSATPGVVSGNPAPALPGRTAGSYIIHIDTLARLGSLTCSERGRPLASEAHFFSEARALRPGQDVTQVRLNSMGVLVRQLAYPG